VRSRLYWPVVVAIALLVGLLTYGVASKGTDTTIDQALTDGKQVKAPVAELPKLRGSGDASLKDYRGKVVVMNFWASWCDPCVKELPLLERTQKRLAAHDATVLGINIQDAPEDALGFVRRFGLTYPSLRDVDRDFARKYGTNGYPETFVVDRDGRVVALRRGPVEQEWLNQHVEPLL
jgi:cytochrome c biogenesis protein CcmG, thiol:disulfide interchange protein DsbE